LLPLDPESAAELEEIGDRQLTDAVDRVRKDPSGQREPRHKYARRFRNTSKYVDTRGRDVWEFKTSKYRALFIVAKGREREGIFFIRVKGKRFMTLGECPWHKGK
jgi:hypothetical protein